MPIRLPATLLFCLALLGPAFAQDSLAPAVALDLPPPALKPLVQGLVRDMDLAAATLDTSGKRRKGTRALDDARRIARVLEEAAASRDNGVAAAGLAAVERARHALQVGDAYGATEILRGASHQLLGFPPDALAARAVGPADAGKLVVDAQGRRIGRLDHLERDGQGWQAVLKVGGAIDLLGFIDWGNRLIDVPARRVVAGRRMLALDWPTTTVDLEQRHGSPDGLSEWRTCVDRTLTSR